MLKSQDRAEQHFQVHQSFQNRQRVAFSTLGVCKCGNTLSPAFIYYSSNPIIVHQVNTKEIIVVTAFGYVILNV